MPKHILVVLTQPTSPEQDAEYNKWYSDVHLDEVLQVPGFSAAQRFKLALNGGDPISHPYLAIYEVETDDPQAAFQELLKHSPGMKMTPAMSDKTVASMFTPITKRVTAKK
jgi:hypothetical protein